MMQKYHIAQAGKNAGASVPCPAKIRCTLKDEKGDPVPHAYFETHEDARAWGEHNAKTKYDAIPLLKKGKHDKKRLRKKYKEIYKEFFGERDGLSRNNVDILIASKNEIEENTFDPHAFEHDDKELGLKLVNTRQEHEMRLAALMGYQEILRNNPDTKLTEFTQKQKDDAFKYGLENIHNIVRARSPKSGRIQRHSESIALNNLKKDRTYRERIDNEWNNVNTDFENAQPPFYHLESFHDDPRSRPMRQKQNLE